MSNGYRIRQRASYFNYRRIPNRNSMARARHVSNRLSAVHSAIRARARSAAIRRPRIVQYNTSNPMHRVRRSRIGYRYNT